MERVAFMQWIKDGCQEDYVQAHSPGRLWPEIVEASQQAGMHNYTGFVGGPGGRLVVGYFETPNLEQVWRELAGNEVNQRWSEGIVPLMETGGDISNGSMEFLKPIWYIP